MNIVLVGAGRLATQLGKALSQNGHSIQAVFSRTMEAADALSGVVGGFSTDNISQLPYEADAYIIAVKDSVLQALIPALAEGREQCCFFHTAGSVPLSVFGGLSHCGVIYPMQTFSKERDVDFSTVPVFIEGSDDLALKRARHIAATVSQRVMELSSEDRRHLHLAAVFACNFSNHCYALAATILERRGLPFDVMLPLIAETARKVETMPPRQAQTGPAVRYDQNIIEAQKQLLAGEEMARQVYDVMSRSIHDLELSC